MRGIAKVFPGVRALSKVDFAARTHEVHALMGENGAGKSTLIKVLTGVYPKDEGTVVFDGKPIAPSAPIEAEALGISTVYQEVNLIPYMSVAENIALGRQKKRFGFLDWRAVRRRAEKALERLDVRIDVSQELSSYSVAIQQMVAIARALDVEAKLLILDEPTSSLDEKETQELFHIMRKLRDEGLGIIFITHFLDQVYQVADRITVLRNGGLVGEYEIGNLPRLALIGKMLGKEPEEVEALGSSVVRSADSEHRHVFLRAQGLGCRGSIAPFDMEIAEGEVLGLAGLLGSGRSEIARLLFGIDHATEGKMTLDEKKVSLKSPRKAIAHRFGYCSEDRKSQGIIPDLSVRENIILAMQASRGPFKVLSRHEQLRVADEYIKALDIKTPGPETPIKSLSGGNQQKVLLARWLAMRSRLLILDEPTRGIDVGAKAEIEKLVATLSTKGTSVLFISSELEEVVRNCQRVLVLRDRRKIGELAAEDIDEDKIMRMIAKSS
jgi:simple sugar transport system ATP-binding protein